MVLVNLITQVTIDINPKRFGNKKKLSHVLHPSQQSRFPLSKNNNDYSD